MLQDERTCNYCPQLQVCTLYHKSVEKGNSKSAGVGKLFDKMTGHLSAVHLEYFKHWNKLIALESQAMKVCAVFMYIACSSIPSIPSSTYPPTHSSTTHPSLHPPIPPPTHRMPLPISIHPSLHPLIPTTNPPTHPLIHSPIHPPTHPSIHQPIPPSTHSSIHPPINPSTHSCTPPLIHPSIRYTSFEAQFLSLSLGKWSWAGYLVS